MFRVADDAAGFAHHIVEALDQPDGAGLQRHREAARRLFGSAGLADELAKLAVRLGLSTGRGAER
jgi:hypothetical protein